MSDVDGFTSAAILYSFLKNQLHIQPQCFFHVGKQHGIRQNSEENLVEQIVDSKTNLLFMPDAGSNDNSPCKILKTEYNIDTVCLDHHEFDNLNKYAIVVNNQMQETTNHDLSGCGVTNKFIQAYCEKFNIDTPYMDDLVAVSLVSDSMNLSALENRAYIFYGLKDLRNPLILIMADKLNRRGNVPNGFSFGLIPLINALQRSNNQEDKKLFFSALVGEGETSEAIKVARKAHRVQLNTVNRILEEIEPTLNLSQPVIIGFAQEEDRAYIGLVANKLMSKYRKPVILLRQADSTHWSGSVRSPIGIKDEINKSGLALCEGHASAHGIILKKANYHKLIDFLNELPLENEPLIQVTCELQTSEITKNLCQIIMDNELMWGQGLPKPVFYVRGKVNRGNIQIFEKSTTTIKLTLNGIDFMLFRAKDEDVKSLQEFPEIEMLVELQLNEWNGNVNPQAIIQKYEIVQQENEDMDWDKLFQL